MSYYYNYYLGFRDQNQMIYPLGPYDCDGKLHSLITESRSFASDLHEDFYCVQEKTITPELRKAFEYVDWNGETVMEKVRYLPANQLPSSNYIKRGYFLLSDIEAYQNNGGDEYDLFYEHMTPEVYLMRMQAELTFGKSQPETDLEGNPIKNCTCADYGYFAYPDHFCKEYDAHRLRVLMDAYEFCACLKDNKEIVILETEG